MLLSSNQLMTLWKRKGTTDDTLTSLFRISRLLQHSIYLHNWFLFATPIDDPQSPYTMTFLELLLAVFRFPMVPRQARHFTRNDVASLSCCALCFSSGLAQFGCSEAVRGEICAADRPMAFEMTCNCTMLQKSL